MIRKEHQINYGVEEKQCYRCRSWFTLEKFYKCKNCWDGLDRQCKKCHKISTKEWGIKNPDKNSLCGKRWRKNNLEKARKLSLDWHKRNPERSRESRIRFAKNNYEKRKIEHRVAEQNKRDNNPMYRVHQSISAGIRYSLGRNKNGSKWELLTGYSLQALTSSLERKFKEGMSWDNYGEWHIDHKKPIVSFNINSESDEQFRECWSLNNLQPLWRIENQIKGAKILSEVEGEK